MSFEQKREPLSSKSNSLSGSNSSSTTTLGSVSSATTGSYVGFANLPNQVHRKSVKKGFEFTLMVVGESGLGKSTLVNSLFLSDLYSDRKVPDAKDKYQKNLKITAKTVEIEERGVKLRLTVVDTPGFGDAIDNTDSFGSIIKYIDDQFEKYFHGERGLNRRNIADNRVHCCFYFISPWGHGLKPLDIEFMKQLHQKVNIVPVIGKADALTKKEVAALKKKITEEIKSHGIRTYTLPDVDEDEDPEYKQELKQLKEAMPFAVSGSTTFIEAKGVKLRGILFPWGHLEIENPEHSDFIKLRTMLITHMQDLQEVTQEVHYENYRLQKLAAEARAGARAELSLDDANSNGNGGDNDEMKRKLQEKEAELRRMQEMVAKMQANLNGQRL